MTTQKETGFTIRIEQELKDAFVATAKSQDRTTSQVLRNFMRDYVKKNGQTDLFKQQTSHNQQS